MVRGKMNDTIPAPDLEIQREAIAETMLPIHGEPEESEVKFLRLGFVKDSQDRHR